VGLVRRRGAWRIGGAVLGIAAVLWGVAFTHGVYGRTNTRLVAADWVAANVPDDAVLSVQEWDDGLPLDAATTERGITTEVLAPFALATPDDARALVAALDRIDYVVETSDRVTGALPQVPARYATTLRYYDALRDGRLGFEHVASFRSGPSLFGLDLDDSASEESFRVYDHPPVDIWRKTDAFDVGAPGAHPTGSGPGRRGRPAEGGRRQRSSSGRRRTDLRPDRPSTRCSATSVPALWWWLWWSVAAWAALPWTTGCCGRCPTGAGA
jgi:hypothetical protein